MCKNPAAATAPAAPATTNNDADDDKATQSSVDDTIKNVSPREAKIIKLNARVDKIVAAEKAKAAAGQATEIHIRLAERPMTLLYSGAPVYVLRSGWLVYSYALFAAVLIGIGCYYAPHPAAALLAVTLTYVGYDLHSGVLHVVFDHPANVHLPIIGQACLEFQWHHSISDDIVRKDFVDVCGDLNIVVGLLCVIHLLLLDLTNPICLLVGGTKILMAYFGQFSHKSAHRINNDKTSLEQMAARTLQGAGMMVSNRDHMSHHKEPYDEDFCLIGLCNPIIDALRHYVTTNNTAWIVGFCLVSIFDLTVFSMVVNALFPQEMVLTWNDVVPVQQVMALLG